jgi:IstB-like ATP binding protein
LRHAAEKVERRATSVVCGRCKSISSQAADRRRVGLRVIHGGRGSELLFEVFSQRYERGATLVTSNLPFDEWTSVFG